MSDKVLHINDADFESVVLNSDKPVFVDFWAKWCGPCKSIAPIIDELAEEMPEVQFVKVDVDANFENASKYGVSSIPNMLVFKGGNVVARQVGTLPKNELKTVIENAIA